MLIINLKDIIMEEIKKNVVEYLTEQQEIFKRIDDLKSLSDGQRKVKLDELYELMSKAHPYADECKIANILASEDSINALAVMVNEAMDAFINANPMAQIVDYGLFAKSVAASILNGMFNPSLRGAIRYV